MYAGGGVEDMYTLRYPGVDVHDLFNKKTTQGRRMEPGIQPPNPVNPKAPTNGARELHYLDIF